MTRARCWNLRLNLDTFNAAFAALDEGKEREDFLVGLHKGLNSGKVKDDCSDSMAVGFAVGIEMREEAEDFRTKSVERGGKRKSNKNDHEVYLKVDHKVDLDGTQSTIHNPQSLNHQPEIETAPSPSRARKSAGKKNESLTPPDSLLPKLATICKDWPRSSDYKGAVAKVSVLARPNHLWERVVRFVREGERELAINCGLVYLDEIELRTRGVQDLIPNVCAMTNFYGDAELWKKMADRVDQLTAKGQS